MGHNLTRWNGIDWHNVVEKKGAIELLLVSCVYTCISKQPTVGDKCLNMLFVKDQRIITLATAIRGGFLHGYTNGQSKTISMELVNLVRLNGLCRKHLARLNVFVFSSHIDTKCILSVCVCVLNT